MLLSIGMIVKNEGKNLRECLNGIKPLLEQIKSELIIADTGSTDDTVTIAREFTDNVYQIEWRNDFAWARNTTLERAKGEWYMFLDADEFFQDVTDIIKFFKSGNYKKYRCASHFMVMQGQDGRDIFTRLYKKEKNTKFLGKSHEQIPLQPPVKRLGSVSLHTGYFYEGEEGKAKKEAKYERNMLPLLEMYKENPSDIRTAALIVNENIIHGKLEETRKYLDIGLKLREKSSVDVFYHFLRYVDLVWYGKSGQYEKVAEEAKDYFNTVKKLFSCAVNMRLVEAHALEELNLHGEAVTAYKEALKLIDMYKAGKLDKEDIEMSISKHISPGMEAFAAGGIAGQYAAMGEFDSAFEWVKKYGLEVSEMLYPVRKAGADGADELERYVRRCYKYLRGINSAGFPDKGLAGRDMFIYHAHKAYEYKEKGDILNFVSSLREAIKADVSMRSVVSEVIEGMKRKRDSTVSNTPASAQERLNKEMTALKDAMYNFIKNGQFDMVEKILAAYSQVNPNDPDIKSIRDMISLARLEENSEGGGNKVKLLEKFGLLSKIETVFILSNFSHKGTGITNSVIRKVNMMEDMWGYRPLILVCEHNLELRRINTVLKHSGYNDNQVRLNKGTRLLSVYDYFQKAYSEDLQTAVAYKKADDGDRYVEISENVYEVYDGETLVRKEYFTGHSDGLRQIEYFKYGKREKGVYYDDWGYISYVREYDPEDGSRYICDNYYTTGQNLCIKTFYKCKNGKNEIEKLIVYDDDGGIIKECADNAELAALCIERIITDDRLYMLVIENGLMSKAATTVKAKNITKVIIVHNVFLENPYDLRHDPQIHYKYLCENHMEFDGIVFLTHSARNDFYTKYNRNIRDIFVIPHPYPYNAAKADFEKRNHRKAVIIARLRPFKQIDYAIDIFAMVVEKLPDVTLDIYGMGPEEEKCREKIKMLSLENNVFLKGFTDKPIAVLSTAAMFMMTSNSEGYPLSLVESICNGCPVFAFDIKYGPSEIVLDGQTGFIFTRYDKEQYAEKMISYFEDVEMQRSMSENAYADTPRFGADMFMETWYTLTETMHKRFIN